MPTITDLQVHDVRFPTSLTLTGSDAMNPDPDNSVCYVVLSSDDGAGPCGYGQTFSIGRGNELLVATVEAMRHLVVGRDLEEIKQDLGGFWRSLTSDGQLRWLGPEKGVVHLATAALTNAVWDLWARAEDKPLWKLLCDLPPEQVVSAVDFRYISDALTPARALELLRRNEATKAVREAEMLAKGYPAYNTSVGWLGFDDEQIRALCREAVEQGWTHFKVKVGRDLERDLARLALVREVIGWEAKLMVDANQVWEVDAAIEHVKAISRFNLWWVEEPTSPDDVLGHARIAREIAPIRVATGEHCQNRIVLKQFLQAGGMGFCQADGCRLGGVNEVLAAVLLCADRGVPFCPHAGGVGIGEQMQHFAIWDYVAVSTTLVDRLLEWVDHSHEHFVEPAQVDGTRYRVPRGAGSSTQLTDEALASYAFPHGPAWSERAVVAGPGGAGR